MKISPISFAVNSVGFVGRKAAEREWQTEQLEVGPSKELCESAEDAFFKESDEQERAENFSYKVGDLLSGRERDTIYRRYGLQGFEPRTREQVAKDLHTSKGIIKNREEKALVKLGQGLTPYCA